MPDLIETSRRLMISRGACTEGVGAAVGDFLAKHPTRTSLARSERVALLEVLDTVGIDDTLRAGAYVYKHQEAERDRIFRLFAADCAERALFRERAAGREPDARSWAAVAVARRYAVGEATAGELQAARAAASAATAAASAYAAAYAAYAAAYAAYAADASAATDAAAYAAAADAAAAYTDAERKWQVARLRLYLTGCTQIPEVTLD